MASISSTLRIRDQMTAPLRRITTALNKTNQGFSRMKTTSATAAKVTTYERLRQKLTAIRTAASNATTAIGNGFRSAGEKVKGFFSKLKSGGGGFDSLKSKVMGLVAAVASLGAAMKALTLADTLANTKARLDMINDGSQTTAELQQKIFESAEKSRGSYQETADAVSKFGLLAGDAFKNNDEIIKFTELLNKQFTISGTSADGKSAAMLQLTQALGAGALRGEELNSILEQAPTIIQDIAKYLGVSVGEIRTMAADGEITADVVKNAMFAMADETNKKFENMPMTFAQIFQSVKNNALTAFQPILTKLTEIGNSEKFQNMVNNLITVISNLASYAVTAFDWLLENWSVFEATALPIIQTVWSAIKTAFTDIWNILQPVIKGIWEIAKVVFPALWNIVQEVVPPIYELIITVFNDVVQFLEDIDLFQIGADIIGGLVNGLGSMIGAVVDTVTNIASSIWDGITGFFDINSPSRLMKWAGQMTFGGFDDGLESQIKDIEGTTVQMGASVMDNYEPEGGFKAMRSSTSQQNQVKYVQPTIHVEMNNQNNISSDMDIDHVIDTLAAKIEEQMAVSAELVHA